MEPAAEIGVIGGTGFYELPGLTVINRVHVPTPWGDPSSAITLGEVHGRRVAFVARHDAGHRLLPSELPARANIYALKRLGIARVIAVSAVGSLREEIEPLHAVVPGQLIDRTRGRASTFFGEGIVAHIGFADPFCPELSTHLGAAADIEGVRAHRGGTLVVIEGPAFSTRAESELYRSWGASVIGMTALPEAKLAREAELCYASLCFATDYDVWHETAADVTVELVLENLAQNTARAQSIVSRTIAGLGPSPSCECGHALDNALVTARELMPAATRRRLDAILARHWGDAP
ncbi:MAG: S-methyl-5'-thioadenosine phosphorylase [Dehalococcoidia bacterium]|nr:S-methyl-5'-thioadenosine phosphorylase [Dehalococcoidia bacterium]